MNATSSLVIQGIDNSSSSLLLLPERCKWIDVLKDVECIRIVAFRLILLLDDLVLDRIVDPELLRGLNITIIEKSGEARGEGLELL